VAARHQFKVTYERAAQEGAPDLEALLARIAPRFSRAEPRQRARRFVQGILSGLRRPNAWTLARYAGDDDPNGMQRLLNAARWDADGVRDDLRAWAVAHLADPGRGVLVVHEYAFPKKGDSSVGVHRRYDVRTGRAGDVQLGVFLAYSTPRGSALIDRELYLPPSWVDDRDRCRRAGVPDGVEAASRPELARRMVQRALDGGVVARWTATDEPYGGSEALRAWLEQRRMGYALAIGGEERVTTATGATAEAQALARRLGPAAWHRAGAKGEHVWALVTLAGSGRDGRRCLLIRRSIAEPDRIGYYRFRALTGSPVNASVCVAGAPSAVRTEVGGAGRVLGLDQYQVRRYDAWYRYVTLCLVAGAQLAAEAATAADVVSLNGGEG
jgi:SRSO17 transposase